MAPVRVSAGEENREEKGRRKEGSEGEEETRIILYF